MDVIKALQIDSKDWIKQHGNPYEYAIENNSVELLNWLYDHGYTQLLKDYQRDINITEIIKHSDAKTIIWLFKRSIVNNDLVYSFLCDYKRYDVIKTIWDQFPPNDNMIEYLIRNTISDHDFVSFTWFWDHSNHNMINLIRGIKSIEALEWFQQHGYELDCSLIYQYIYPFSLPNNQALEIFKWMHRHKCPIREDLLSGMIIFGDLDITKWAYDNGYDIVSSDTLSEALRNSEYKIAQWLYDIGAEATDGLVNDLIQDNDLDQLIWLYDRGVEFNSEDLVLAMGDDYDIMDWLDSIGVRIDNTNEIDILISQTENLGNPHHLVELLVWLHNHKYALPQKYLAKIKPRTKG